MNDDASVQISIEKTLVKAPPTPLKNDARHLSLINYSHSYSVSSRLRSLNWNDERSKNLLIVLELRLLDMLDVVTQQIICLRSIYLTKLSKQLESK